MNRPMLTSAVAWVYCRRFIRSQELAKKLEVRKVEDFEGVSPPGPASR